MGPSFRASPPRSNSTRVPCARRSRAVFARCDGAEDEALADDPEVARFPTVALYRRAKAARVPRASAFPDLTGPYLSKAGLAGSIQPVAQERDA